MTDTIQQNNGLFRKPETFNKKVSNDISKTQCLRILGLGTDSSQAEIEKAYEHLVADITPGADATHSRVDAAKVLLAEVELAYSELAAS